MGILNQGIVSWGAGSSPIALHLSLTPDTDLLLGAKTDRDEKCSQMCLQQSPLHTVGTSSGHLGSYQLILVSCISYAFEAIKLQ